MKIKFTLLFSLIFVLTSNAQFKSKQLKEVQNLEPSQAVSKPSNLEFQEPKFNEDLFELLHDARTFSHPQKDFKVVSYDENGQPRFLKSKTEFPYEGRENALQELRDFITSAEPSLGFKDEENEFVLLKSWTDELGMDHFKCQQVFKDIPVYGAEFIVHGNQSIFNSLLGKTYPTPKLVSTVPTLDRAQLLNTVEEEFGPITTLNPDQEKLVGERYNATLVIYHLDQNKNNEHLAYHVSFYPDVIHRYELIIDAHSGEILKKYTGTCKLHCTHTGHVHAAESAYPKKDELKTSLMDGPATANALDLNNVNRLINTWEVGLDYVLVDASRTMFNGAQSVMPNEPVGVIWTVDGGNDSPQNSNFQIAHNVSSNNTWNNQQIAVSAHFNAGEAYEYFKSEFGRESINGMGGNIVSIINVTEPNGQGMDNAFWNGYAMFYGNGDFAFTSPLAKSLDVAAHEMSHGVIQATANLEYYGESGAINESYADIFGAMVDGDGSDWLIGEDVVNTGIFTGGALRNMQDPHNGQSTNNFNDGWQPKKVSEMYNGQEDNAGVHWNSGIPNHAYYLFATEVGTHKAERVFYRALENYLTMSSQFVDLRIATEQAVQDLYGQAELNALQNAFDQVEIFGGEGGNYQNDLEENPGNDYIVFTGQDKDRLGLITDEATVAADPLTQNNPISRPSVTDDGSVILYVADDKMIHAIVIDWDNAMFEQQVVSSDPIWRNVVISRDGRRFAALTEDFDNKVWVYDFVVEGWNEFELFNPTTSSSGATTGDVLYADAMEFDHSGESLIYDALNEISGQSGQTIEYWDVGFLKVWNSEADIFSLGQINKLFSQLPENVSVGNPTFSHNSPYIVAFDVLDNGEYGLIGYNIETGDAGLIYENSGLSYPSYSRLDDRVIFNAPWAQGIDLGIVSLQGDKITAVPNSEALFFEEGQIAVWFANGDRSLVNTNEIQIDDLSIKVAPNPVTDVLQIDFDALAFANVKVQLLNSQGQIISSERFDLRQSQKTRTIDMQSLPSGMYYLHIWNGNTNKAIPLVKI